MTSNPTDTLTTNATGAFTGSAVVDGTPDYEALASEVVLLMAQMRPPHRPPHAEASNGNDNSCDDFPPPEPPVIPPDLMEIGRGSVGVLGALSHLGGQATPGKLGQITGLSKGRVSNIIRALEEKGYVEKRPSPTDSRSVTVALSTKGHEVTDRHTNAMRAHVTSMLRQLGPRDAEDGVRVMRHLAQILKEKCSDRPQEASR